MNQVTSSSHHHQLNGKSESEVMLPKQLVKKTRVKCKCDKANSDEDIPGKIEEGGVGLDSKEKM